MVDQYTYVAKPTDSTYTFTNPQGRQIYDDPTLFYDDPNAFYDSVNDAAYSYVPKPTGGTQSIATAGQYYGFGSFTYSGGQVLGSDPYTYVAKPSN